jgi:hypothetical protein
MILTFGDLACQTAYPRSIYAGGLRTYCLFEISQGSWFKDAITRAVEREPWLGIFLRVMVLACLVKISVSPGCCTNRYFLVTNAWERK